MTTQKIVWLLFHEPVDLFLRTAQAFSEKILDLTEGRIKVERSEEHTSELQSH